METRQTERVALAPSRKLRTLAASMLPDVARQFHSFVVRLLAPRLAAANAEIEALL